MPLSRSELEAHLNACISDDYARYSDMPPEDIARHPASITQDYPRPILKNVQGLLSRLSEDPTLRDTPPRRIEAPGSFLADFGQASACLVAVGDTRFKAPASMCPEAEMFFEAARVQAKHPHTGPDAHRRLSVYHTADREALFLRKSKASTALGLRAVELAKSGLILPAGTIYGLASHVPKKRITGQQIVEPGRGRFSKPAILHQSIEFDPEEDALIPLRLSAWAFDEAADRELFAAHGKRNEEGSLSIDIYTAKQRRLEATTLADMQHATNTLLERCYGNR